MKGNRVNYCGYGHHVAVEDWYIRTGNDENDSTTSTRIAPYQPSLREQNSTKADIQPRKHWL